MVTLTQQEKQFWDHTRNVPEYPPVYAEPEWKITVGARAGVPSLPTALIFAEPDVKHCVG